MPAGDLLLQPYRLNHALPLKNRIIMAPMTRNLANTDFTPTDAMVHYYSKRADAGLIITEGTLLHPFGRSANNIPGIFTQNHIEGWQQVTAAVHQRGGLIMLQLWHVGRVSHPVFLEGNLPISASETVMMGKVKRTADLYHGRSRAASVDEIKELIAHYAQAAVNAIKAGFEGVEIHGANGYLIDQFLHYTTNHRQDDYGQTPENMARFALAIVKACGDAIGYSRVGLRISPGGYLNEIVGDNKDALVFKYLLEQLNPLSIAYVHTGNFDDAVQFPELDNQTMTAFIRAHYQGTVIACGQYNAEKARVGIGGNQYDLVAFGRPFIANPDLISRLKRKSELVDFEQGMLETLN